jgi:hypothetical protein
MVEYLDEATKATFNQIVHGFVIVFAIALFMNGIGRRLRANLSGRLGGFYDYFVLPGCLCHEMGRTLGCIISGVGVDRFEIFNLDTDDSVRIPIAVSVNKRFAFIRRFLILTGPIWFCAALVGLVTLLAAGSETFPSYASHFGAGEDVGLVSYLAALATSALGMVVNLFFAWNWTSPFCLLVFYLLFCIGSQTRISGSSLLLIWQSILCVFVLLFVLNLIPGVNAGVRWLGDRIMPAVFMLHVTLLFSAFLNVAFLLLVRLLPGKARRSGNDASPHRSAGRHSGVYVSAR